MKEEQEVDPSVAVSQWLREVGRRRWRRADPASPPYAPGAQGTTPDAPRGPNFLLRRTLLLALLVVLALHYVYANVTVEILSLPALVVFVFAG